MDYCINLEFLMYLNLKTYNPCKGAASCETCCEDLLLLRFLLQKSVNLDNTFHQNNFFALKCSKNSHSDDAAPTYKSRQLKDRGSKVMICTGRSSVLFMQKLSSVQLLLTNVHIFIIFLYS